MEHAHPEPRTRILPQRGTIQRARLRGSSQSLELCGPGALAGGDIQPPLRGAFRAHGLYLRLEALGLQRGLAALRGFTAAVTAQGNAVGLFALVDEQEIIETGGANALRQGLCGFAVRSGRQASRSSSGWCRMKTWS